jgi:hypothetical protein
MNRCRECACTDDRPCWVGDFAIFRGGDFDRLTEQQLENMDLRPCGWVELGEAGLCTGCVQQPAAPLMFDGDGKPLRGAP